MNNQTNQKYDIEDRLIDFSVYIIKIVEKSSSSKSSNHMFNQLIRSGTSPALNYGEAQSGEYRKDFIHKMKICLKELRETKINLKIILKAKLYDDENDVVRILKENSELIAIFSKSIETASKQANCNL